MKKMFNFITVLFIFLLINFSFGKNQNIDSTKSTNDYSDEQSGVMIDSDMENSQNNKAEKKSKKTIKKVENITEPSDYNSSYNFKEYEFKDFKIKIPEICKVKVNPNKTSAIIGEEGSECFFGGKISEIPKKKKMNYLIKMYKNRCKIKKSQLILRKWIKNEGVEGYLSICASEKADIMIELNSNKKEITYQFSGNAYKIFNEDEKKAFMSMLNSIKEK